MEPAEIRDSVLRYYYDAEQKKPTGSAQTGEVSETLGIPDEQVSSAIAYLQQKGFLRVLSSVKSINYPTPLYLAQITAVGIDHVDAQSVRAQIKSVVKKSLIFISCGQYTPDEIRLGLEMAAAVDELTPHHGYFAQQVSTLETLSSDILEAIQQCVGFVAVMHNRGEFETPDCERIMRASVWIEQEIAIAAFVQQRLRKKIEVHAYLHEGMSREGLRQQLHIIATTFTKNEEVIADFRVKLTSGAFGGSAKASGVRDEERRHRELFEPQLSILPETIKIENRDERFAVILRNDGNGSAFKIKVDTQNSSDGNMVYYPPPATLPKDGRHVLITKHPQTRVEIMPILVSYEDQFGQRFESKSGRDFVAGSKYDFQKLTEQNL